MTLISDRPGVVLFLANVCVGLLVWWTGVSAWALAFAALVATFVIWRWGRRR